MLTTLTRKKLICCHLVPGGTGHFDIKGSVATHHPGSPERQLMGSALGGRRGNGTTINTQTDRALAEYPPLVPPLDISFTTLDVSFTTVPWESSISQQRGQRKVLWNPSQQPGLRLHTPLCDSPSLDFLICKMGSKNTGTSPGWFTGLL